MGLTNDNSIKEIIAVINLLVFWTIRSFLFRCCFGFWWRHLLFILWPYFNNNFYVFSIINNNSIITSTQHDKSGRTKTARKKTWRTHVWRFFFSLLISYPIFRPQQNEKKNQTDRPFLVDEFLLSVNCERLFVWVYIELISVCVCESVPVSVTRTTSDVNFE